VAHRVAKGLQEESGLQAMSARVVKLQGSLAAAGDSDTPFCYELTLPTIGPIARFAIRYMASKPSHLIRLNPSCVAVGNALPW
jgi:hypothetical protein